MQASVNRGPVGCIAGVSGRSLDSCIPLRTALASARQTVVRAASADGQPLLGDRLKQLARQIQGQLPIIGLFSKLASPSGGFGDEQSYQEFCRAALDSASPAVDAALADLEKRYPRVGSRRYVLLILWMAQTGAGVVPARTIVAAARRVRVTHDLGDEIDRFQSLKDQTLQGYSYVRPERKPMEQANIAVDAICRMVFGLQDGEAVPPAEEGLVQIIVSNIFPDPAAAATLVQQSMACRIDRGKAYTV